MMICLDIHSDVTVRAMLRDQPENTMDMEIFEDIPMEYLNMETVHGYRNSHKSLRPGHPFERYADDEYLRSIGAAYKMNTANKLFWATATSWDVECTSAPFKWLAEGINTYSEIMNMGGVALDKYRNDDKGEYISFTKELLKQADINISDISIDIKEMFPGDNLFSGQGIYPVNADSAFSVEVITGHIIKKVDGTEEKYNLHIQDESLGAQLIATTHETTVLSLDTLRRDQIYFTEKDNKNG